MGKQFIYYATPGDETVFVEEITRLGGRFIRGAFQKPEEMAVPSLPLIQGVPPRDMRFFLYCPLFNDSLAIKSYETGVHAIDQAESLVIDFLRSHIMGPVIFYGRLWYEPCRENGTNKPDEFISWAQQVFSWVKSHFVHRQERARSYYLGPEVVARLELGELKLA
jgi:hypothetical protein